MGILRQIEPWLPPGLGGRAIKLLVVSIFLKIAFVIVVGAVLLALFATGRL